MEENPRGYEEIEPTDLMTGSGSEPFANASTSFFIEQRCSRFRERTARVS
jgi:hypothetical protein